MKTRLLSTAAVAIALTLLLIPARVAPAQAQMGQTTPLDQLSGDDFDKAFLQQMLVRLPFLFCVGQGIDLGSPNPLTGTGPKASDEK